MFLSVFSSWDTLATKSVRKVSNPDNSSAILLKSWIIKSSFACSVFDGIRHKKTVEEPVRRILQATHQLTQGDFSARIQPLHESGEMNELDLIIHDFNKMAEEFC